MSRYEQTDIETPTEARFKYTVVSGAPLDKWQVRVHDYYIYLFKDHNGLGMPYPGWLRLCRWETFEEARQAAGVLNSYIKTAAEAHSAMSKATGDATRMIYEWYGAQTRMEDQP